jgi:hypothetical protein
MEQINQVASDEEFDSDSKKFSSSSKSPSHKELSKLGKKGSFEEEGYNNKKNTIFLEGEANTPKNNQVNKHIDNKGETGAKEDYRFSKIEERTIKNVAIRRFVPPPPPPIQNPYFSNGPSSHNKLKSSALKDSILKEVNNRHHLNYNIRMNSTSAHSGSRN